RIPGTCLSRSESFIVLGASVMGKRFQGSYYQGIDYSKSSTKPRRPTDAKPPLPGAKMRKRPNRLSAGRAHAIQVVDRRASDKLLAHVGKLRAVARVDLLALAANNHATQDRRVGDERHILGAEGRPDAGLLRVVERNSGHDLQRRSQPLRLRRQRSEELIHHLLLPVLACHLANQMAGSSDAQRDDLAAHVGESQLLLGLGLAAGLLDDAAGLSASLLLDLAGSFLRARPGLGSQALCLGASLIQDRLPICVSAGQRFLSAAGIVDALGNAFAALLKHVEDGLVRNRPQQDQHQDEVDDVRDQQADIYPKGVKCFCQWSSLLYRDGMLSLLTDIYATPTKMRTSATTSA